MRDTIEKRGNRLSEEANFEENVRQGKTRNHVYFEKLEQTFLKLPLCFVKFLSEVQYAFRIFFAFLSSIQWGMRLMYRMYNSHYLVYPFCIFIDFAQDSASPDDRARPEAQDDRPVLRRSGRHLATGGGGVPAGQRTDIRAPQSCRLLPRRPPPLPRRRRPLRGTAIASDEGASTLVTKIQKSYRTENHLRPNLVFII